MVIKCIKTSTPNNNSYIINSESKEWMKVGEEYIVYGVRISKHSNYYMIFNGNHLIEIPTQKFRIINGKVSSSWIIQNDEVRGLTLWPELFYTEDFFENFSEWEEIERNKFKELKNMFKNQ